jgi:hypothetical protein
MIIGIAVATWIFLSLLIATGGRRYRFGFWGYFFSSVLLSPIIGLLLLIAAVPLHTARSR